MKPLALAAIILFMILPARAQSAVSNIPAKDTFMLKEGSYLGFRQVNLSMGEIGFEVLVSSKTKNKSKLEFRIDMPKGRKSKLIGTLSIPYTADTTLSLKLRGRLRNAWGVHDLYLVGKGAEFNISGFGFIFNY